ncbi:MAG: branched-chain amino acid ABC transporter permease [Proteobacteria bacterium]|nr:branched-chain amino acid ABC transporter permease [Pseudomonadota bacterium]
MSAGDRRTRSLAERVTELRPNPLVAAVRSAWPFVIAIVIAFVLQAVVAPAMSPFKAKMLLDIGIAIVLASSLNIVNGMAGQFSIGHAGFMMIGGYAAAVVTYYGSIKLLGVPLGVDVPVIGGFMGSGDLLFLASCIVGGIFAAVAGLVVGLPSLRLRGDYLAIVTLGFGEILRVLVQQTPEVPSPKEAAEAGLGTMMSHLGGALSFTGTPTYVSPTPWLENASGEQTGHAGIFFTYLIVGILLVLIYRLKTANQGRRLLAVRENEIAAEACGVNTSRTKVTAFVLAAFFAGVGGALFAHELGATLSPKELGFMKSIDLVIMVVLGGMGSITGVVCAAAFLTVLPELLRTLAPMITNLIGVSVNPDAYRMPLYALALILVMILRPQGLFGIRELWDLRWWKRYVTPAWTKIAGGWLIPRAPKDRP